MNRHIVVGAGPAGLTAAYAIAARGEPVLVLERDTRVGGIAQTVEYKGFRFDLGGHRFFTKVPIVADLWRRMLGPDFLRRRRLSRIYYGGRFFAYPLRPVNALLGLGILGAGRVMASYLWARLHPIRPERTFEDWVVNRFGRRLFNVFFKTYTEKVWGIPCEKIGAQWAAQRIKSLSIATLVKETLLGPFRRRPTEVRTLIEEFDYPRLGPGMMWERFRQAVEERGGGVELHADVVAVHHDGRRVHAVDIVSGGMTRTEPAASLLSTMPLRELVAALSPPPPEKVRRAAERLNYRDFVTVALILDRPDLFPDTWIYVHDPRVKVGRIQNMRSWSPDLVPDPGRACISLEYFCNEGDALWTAADTDLLALATRELAVTGLTGSARVVDGTVVRVPKAYPVYDEGYADALAVVRDYLRGFENLQVAGRNGMHKYNNQDHSMVTALLAVENLFGACHDVWAVNDDDEYHEQAATDAADLGASAALLRLTQPLVPRTLKP